MSRVVHVAVGVVLDDSDRILIARRAEQAHQGGLWEFPGGKVELGETVSQALARELEEELGIRIAGSSPLLQVRHDYGDKAVLLDVHLVQSFTGTALGLEGQPLNWVMAGQLGQFQFPAANESIVEAVVAHLTVSKD
jgi:8-oxo-dGTP diphosphatase